MNNKHKKNTTDLFSDIRFMTKDKDDKALKDFINQNENEFLGSSPVSKYIREVLGAEKLKAIDIKDMEEITGMSYSYLHQIIPTKYKLPTTTKIPDRKKLIAIALYLRFSVDQTQRLLKYAKQPELYPRDKFDSIILYALGCRYGIVETNILLKEHNFDMLGKK